MAIYYKFNLYNTKSIELKKKIEIAERTDGWFTFKNLKVTKKEMEKIENNLRQISHFDKYDYCDSIEVENILINQMEKLPFSFTSVPKASIIGEVIYDEDNNMYVRELITKLVFPIKNKFDYITNLRLIRELKDYTSHYSVVFERGISFSSILDLNILALNQKVANQNELDEYLKTFDGIFSKRKKKVYYEKLKTLSQENVFKEGLKFLENKKEDPKKEIVRESQSQITKRMESIEYLLDALKNKDEKIYLEYKNKYEELLKLPNLTLVPLSLLEGEIEFYFILGTRDANNILENLTNIKKEYLYNFLTGNENKTDLDFKKINKINELFLKVKDKYDYLNQREVIKSLSFLYLMEVYENKEFITIEELENSYFADNLKTIYLCLKALKNLDLITCEYFIELYDEITCENIFDMIRNISFKKYSNNDVKSLLLRI